MKIEDFTHCQMEYFRQGYISELEQMDLSKICVPHPYFDFCGQFLPTHTTASGCNVKLIRAEDLMIVTEKLCCLMSPLSYRCTRDPYQYSQLPTGGNGNRLSVDSTDYESDEGDRVKDRFKGDLSRYEEFRIDLGQLNRKFNFFFEPLIKMTDYWAIFVVLDGIVRSKNWWERYYWYFYNTPSLYQEDPYAEDFFAPESPIPWPADSDKLRRAVSDKQKESNAKVDSQSFVSQLWPQMAGTCQNPLRMSSSVLESLQSYLNGKSWWVNCDIDSRVGQSNVYGAKVKVTYESETTVLTKEIEHKFVKSESKFDEKTGDWISTTDYYENSLKSSVRTVIPAGTDNQSWFSSRSAVAAGKIVSTPGPEGHGVHKVASEIFTAFAGYYYQGGRLRISTNDCISPFVTVEEMRLVIASEQEVGDYSFDGLNVDIPEAPSMYNGRLKFREIVYSLDAYDIAKNAQGGYDGYIDLEKLNPDRIPLHWTEDGNRSYDVDDHPEMFVMVKFRVQDP